MNLGSIYEHIIHFSSSSSQPLSIFYTNSLSTVENWLSARLSEGVAFIGMDPESKPQYSAGEAPHPPSVLQLSTCRHACVFQLNASDTDLTLASTAAPLLYGLLFPSASNATQIRLQVGGSPLPLVGMGASKDLLELEPIFAFHLDDDPLPTASKTRARSIRRDRHPHCVDLESLKLGGLLSLAQECTGVVKWKSNNLQMSNWERWPLQRSRLVYSAMDAWAGCAIMQHYKDHPPFPSVPGPAPAEVAGPREQTDTV